MQLHIPAAEANVIELSPWPCSRSFGRLALKRRRWTSGVNADYATRWAPVPEVEHIFQGVTLRKLQVLPASSYRDGRSLREGGATASRDPSRMVEVQEIQGRGGFPGRGTNATVNSVMGPGRVPLLILRGTRRTEKEPKSRPTKMGSSIIMRPQCIASPVWYWMREGRDFHFKGGGYYEYPR